MWKPYKEFPQWMFYEEFLDKERGISQGTCLAVKAGTRVPQAGNEPSVFGIGVQANGQVESQAIAIQYLYDYCIKVPQRFAEERTPELIQKLKAMGEKTKVEPKVPNRPAND